MRWMLVTCHACLDRPTRQRWLLLLGLVLTLLWPRAFAQGVDTPARSGPQRIDAVEVELVAERRAVRPGETLLLGLRMAHAPGWHTYWRNSGDSGLPTVIEPVGPPGSRFDPIRWPAPARFWIGPLANYGYDGEVLLPFAVHLPADLGTGSVRFEAAAQWLVCREVCIPGEARLALELPVAAASAGASPPSAQAGLFEAMARRTPQAGRGLTARLYRQGDGAALVLDESPAGVSRSRAEFFPHAPSVVAAAAPQVLLQAGRALRLDLALADGATLPQALDGLLMLDDRPFALSARAVPGTAPEGRQLSVAGPPAETRPAQGGLLAAAGLGGERSAPTQGSSGSASVAGQVSPAGSGAQVARTGSAGADATASAWWISLPLAMLGGLLLNLMPCVFPVIGLKVLGFAQGAPDSHTGRQAMRRGGLAFALGVLVSFWMLGALMLAIRAAGGSVGWGFQLQSPMFVAVMALLFVLIGLNFSGVYEMGLAFTRLQGAGSAKHSTLASFGAGVLAVLVASPCTAPFMGSALGLTLTQPTAQALAVFTAIGLGMALPYALLGCFPDWLRHLPRPGRWMQTLREALAFPMYASAAWLAWVLAQQAGVDALLRLLLAAVAVSAAAWAWGRWTRPPGARIGLALGLGLTGLAVALALLAPVAQLAEASQSGRAADAGVAGAGGIDAASSSGQAWQAWSDERVAQGLARGQVVFVDFTAAWCVTCQVNKQLVLDRDPVREAFERQGVLTLRADWTQRDARISQALARQGRNGVPMYLVHRPGQAAPVLLPELLTARAVLDAIR